MQDKTKIILLIIFLGLIGGAASTFGKIALREVSPVIFNFLRFIVAAIVLLPFLIGTRDAVENKKKLILISLFATGNVMFFVFGLKFTTATISQTLYAGGPLLAGVFSYFILKEEINPRKVLGIIIGFVGTLLIIFGPIINSSSIWNGTFFGNAMLCLAVISFSLYAVFSKKYNNEYSSISFIKYFIFTTLIAQTVFLAFSPLKDEIASIARISPLTWFSIIFVGLISTTLYYFLYQRILKGATPVLASMILYLQPLAGILWARILLHERFTPIFLAGGTLIFLGIALVFYDKYFKYSKADA